MKLPIYNLVATHLTPFQEKSSQGQYRRCRLASFQQIYSVLLLHSAAIIRVYMQFMDRIFQQSIPNLKIRYKFILKFSTNTILDSDL